MTSMKNNQVHHLSECMRGLHVESLRFTVYKRGLDGGIIELLNTGMVRINRFYPGSGMGGGDSSDAEIILDFEQDVRTMLVSLKTQTSLHFRWHRVLFHALLVVSSLCVLLLILFCSATPLCDARPSHGSNDSVFHLPGQAGPDVFQRPGSAGAGHSRRCNPSTTCGGWLRALQTAARASPLPAWLVCRSLIPHLSLPGLCVDH